MRRPSSAALIWETGAPAPRRLKRGRGRDVRLSAVGSSRRQALTAG